MMFKYPKDYFLTLTMHPLAIMILGYAAYTAEQMNVPFTVTSTVSNLKEDQRLGRISSSHRTGRAFDVSIYGWTTDDIDNFKLELEKKFGEYGAISKSDGSRRLVVIHNGTAPHIHVQISANYAHYPVFPDL